MSETVVTRLTFADLERLPESPCRQELLDGELIELPPPKKKHNISAERFYDRLRVAITEAHGRGVLSHLGEVHHEMGYRFEDDGWLIPARGPAWRRLLPRLAGSGNRNHLERKNGRLYSRQD
jgi:Uma2 family endonuclease